MAAADSIGDAAGRDGQPPRRFMGLRLSAMLETLAFLAAALVFDAFIGAGDRLSGLTPHPFWIIVLLVSAQYGAREGLVSALLASAALLVGNLPEQGFSEDLYAWLLRATLDPLLWIFGAIAVGEISDAQRRERDTLREELHESREHAEGIGAAYERLAVLKDHLEGRVAGQVRTVRSIFVASRGIERQDTGQVLAGIQQLVSAVMNPRKFSLYLVNGPVLEAALSEGWTGDDTFAHAFAHDAPLFQAVVSHRRFLVATRPSHGLVLGTEGLLAGPLTCSDTDEVIGMLKIEAMDFLDFNPSSVQNFAILCQWIGGSYANARRWEQGEAGRYFDASRQLLPAPLFAMQRDLAAALAAREGFDVSILLIGLDMPEAAGPRMQPVAARAVSQAAAALLGPADGCFDWRRDGWDVAILLPGTGRSRAEALASRLLPAMAEALEMAALKVGLRHRVAAPQHEAAEAPRAAAE